MISGKVKAGPSPIITPNAVLQIFNPVIGGTLAPGNVVQIYGTGFPPEVSYTLDSSSFKRRGNVRNHRWNSSAAVLRRSRSNRRSNSV